MNNQLLHEIYKLNLQQEQYFLSAHHTRLSTYLAFASALIGATIAGALKATNTYQNLMLCAGPALIIIVAEIGKLSCSRFYQRFLETITIRAKLESDLGFDETRATEGHWTEAAPFVAARHLTERNCTASEKDFVATRMKLGEQLATTRLFRSLQVLGVILLLALTGRAMNWI